LRQIVLDTETTGLDQSDGHRMIEIGCVELIDRRLTDNRFHFYLNPDRESDEGALEVHGITTEFLADKPRFSEIADDLLAYLKDAELVIHNAPFDVGFINAEYKRLDPKWRGLEYYCAITDTLKLARKMHPGQKNNLDALCKRYEVNNAHRDLHGALLDAEILSEVYLAMTGGQTVLILGKNEEAANDIGEYKVQLVRNDRPALHVIAASEDELVAHEQRLDALEKTAGQSPVWRQIEVSEN